MCDLHPSLFLGKAKAVKDSPSRVPPSWLLLLTFTPELNDVVIETKKGHVGTLPVQAVPGQRISPSWISVSTNSAPSHQKNKPSPHFPTKFLHSAGTPCPLKNHHFQVPGICCFSITPTLCCKQTETPRGQLPCLHKLRELWLLHHFTSAKNRALNICRVYFPLEMGRHWYLFSFALSSI